MKALILETSGPIPWVALSKGKKILEMRTLPDPHQLSLHLHSTLEELLEDFNLHYVAVGIGPGSYAGSRTAVTVAKTLAFAWNTPLVSFPSPLAFLPTKLLGSFTYIVDAKMGQCALFEWEIDQKGVKLAPFQLLNKEDLPLHLTKEKVIIQGTQAPNPALVASYVHDKYLAGELVALDDLQVVYFR